jgi:Glyoxalase-like domain
MHKILLRTVVLDFEPGAHDAALEFWKTALASEARAATHLPEYHVMRHPAAVGSVVVQRLGEGASRIHLDIESDDVPAEVERLAAAGASVVQTVNDWTVMRDPAGLLFCVVPAGSVSGNQDFDELARIVEDD